MFGRSGARLRSEGKLARKRMCRTPTQGEVKDEPKSSYAIKVGNFGERQFVGKSKMPDHRRIGDDGPPALSGEGQIQKSGS